MCNRQVLFMTKTNDLVVEDLKNECIYRKIVPTTTNSFSEMMQATTFSKFEAIVIDADCFYIDDDILSVFDTRIYFIPTIIVFSKKNRYFSNSNVVCINKKSKEEFFSYLFAGFSKDISPMAQYSNTILHDNIVEELTTIGVNPKYKGFNFIVDIINRVILLNDFPKSLNKSIFPYIARLHNTTPACVERDIRNLLQISYSIEGFAEKINFNEELYSPTTNNLLNALTLYIKGLI